MPRVRLPNGQVVEMSESEYRQYQGGQSQSSGNDLNWQGPVIGGATAAGVKQGVNLGTNAITEGLSSTAPTSSSALGSSSAALTGGESMMPAGWSTYEGITSSLAPQVGSQTGAGWGSTLSAAAPYVGLAGMGYWWGNEAKNSYDQLTNETSSDDGAGSIKAGLLTNPLTFWAAPLVDYAGIKAGKGRDQQKRDGYRKNLREFGILDDDYNLSMSDGSIFNLGSEKLRDAAGNVIEGVAPENRAYNIDWKTADNDLIGALNPIAFSVAGGDDKLQADLVGQLYNAAKQTDDPYSFVAELYGKFQEQGLGRDQMAQLITERASEKGVDNAIRDALISGVDVNTRNQIGQENSPKGRYQPGAQAQASSQSSVKPEDRNGGRPSPVQPKSSSGGFALSRQAPMEWRKLNTTGGAKAPNVPGVANPKNRIQGRPSTYEKDSNKARATRRK